MDNRKYGICIKPCNIQLTPVHLNNSGFLSAGSLFEILQRFSISEALIKRLMTDQIDKRRINYEKETYICDINYFREIDYKMFLLMLAVRQEKRLNIINNEQLMVFVKNLCINQKVIIPKNAFHGRQTDVVCVVRYIGEVPEIGLGIFFGFIIVDPFDSIPPRGSLSHKYLKCDNTKGFIRAIDVFNKNPQHNNELRSFPSVSSIDPYGSMESLSSERSFGKSNNRHQNRNANYRNNNRDGGMPIYKGQTNFATGMNLINFEPVNPNFMRPSTPANSMPIPLMSINVNKMPNLNQNVRRTNNVLPSPLNPIPLCQNQMSTPSEYLLPKAEPTLSFAPVPNNVVTNIIQKSNQNANRENLRQKYEILKREFDILKNAKANRLLETNSLDNNQDAARPNQTKVSENRSGPKCILKSCCIANKSNHLQRPENEYNWDGRTEFYTNSIHHVKCLECQQLKLKCYASKLYGGNRDFNEFITVLKASGYNVSFPENKYLAITDQDKTKLISVDEKRNAYYECTIRANITIHKNRFKSQCRKCKLAVDVSQGISLITCHHLFCNNCIKSQIKSNEMTLIKCPDARCAHRMLENEVHAFMTDAEFQLYLQRMQGAAKFKPDDNLFYCKNKLCNSCISINRENRDNIVLLYCPECGQFNCVVCNTIHTGLTCDDYQKNQSPKLPAVAIEASDNIRIKTVFKCKAQNCRGYLQEPNEAINLIACPECSTINCRTCEDIHVDMTCREYQRDKNGISESGRRIADYNDEKWVCKNCTYLNTEKTIRCKMCFSQRTVNLVQAIDNYHLDHESEVSDDAESILSCTEENQYGKLLELDDIDIIRNTSQFLCIICYDNIDVGEGVKLHDCLHEFCEECLKSLIKANSQAPITCPFSENDFVCEGTIQHREMKSLDEDVYEQYLYRSVLQAQKDLKNCFQCKTPDCRAMWEYDDDVFYYKCPSCEKINCHQCNAVHGTMSCRDYQEKLYEDTNPDALATRKLYDEWFACGKAVRCPQCKIAIVREEGCSWVVCSQCKTEICWATRGPRWGPKGNGDTSGGCRCDYKNGKPCHPDCGYCH